jgi:two-component system sensor histidine kinase RegB
MSAALLSWQASACLALLVLVIYAGLMQFFVPLVPAGGGHHHGHDQLMQLHLFGMWVTFCLSVLLILVFVIPLAASIRRQKELIARQREQSLQDERIVAMATFAASAAHQLGTPLSTLSVLAEDLAEEFRENQQVQEDIALMAEQVALCKTTLHSMMRRADAIRRQERQRIAVAELLQHIRQQFNLLNPAREVVLETAPVDNVMVQSDETLEQALLNLLDNAARAADENPRMAMTVSGHQVCISITDRGPGVPEEIQQALGEPFVSTRDKNEGMGLGLFLSHATINRLGGRLKMTTTRKGTRTEVWLPMVSGRGESS